MATFYSCSNDKRDIMQTLYMRETGNSSNLESSVNGNMLYMGYSSAGPYSEILAGNSGQSQQNCMELPVSNTPVTQNSVVGGLDVSASQIMEQTYNAWRDGKDEQIMQVGGSMNGADGLFSRSINDEMGLHKQLSVLTGQNSSLTSPSQGLSLTLSTQIAAPLFPYQSANSDISIVSSHQSASVNSGSCEDDRSRNKPMHGNLSHGLSTLTSFIPNSKYLKVAQQLFDEVVSVSEALKNKEEKCQILNSSVGTSSCKEIEGSRSDGMPANNQQSLANLTTELGHPERQELQNRITKLVAMLDEIDRRYKQYYHQMQTVVSWFDVIAGAGAAKPYTALALQTISRHFRCLRDAIGCQIQSLRKSLGEEDNSSGKGGGLPRLRHIDLQLRQQRAMQQLGMMQPHAWRPQRGLPEASVSILRAWLFEHFLHPYPNDSDKLMLARQTGLSRSQVSNWFINARVRLWKPMIEEMHKEETGDAEMDSNSSSDNVSKGRNDLKSSEDREDFQSPDAERCQTNSDLDISRTTSGYNYKPNMDDAYVNFELSDQGPIGEDSGLLHDALSHSDVSDRFMAYQMADLQKYGNGGVSLTLGLQHCNVGMASSGQQGFLTMREEDMYTTTTLHVGAEATAYDYMNPMDRPQAFGGSLN